MNNGWKPGKGSSAGGGDPLAREVLARLPLADAVLSLWAYVMQPQFLNGVFQRHRGRSFEDVLTFPAFVQLIADALLQHQGSGRQAFERALREDRLPTSVEAVYGKLRRVPVGLSEGLLAEGAARLRELQPGASHCQPWPTSLAGFTPVIVDGKKLKNAAKRRLPTRGQAGKLYGGKLLVAYVPTEGLVRAFSADIDGEANDCRLMPALIPKARQAISGPKLWILDRQFCDLTQPQLLVEDGDQFLIRYHPKVRFECDPSRSSQLSQDSQGRAVVDEWGWLGTPKKERLYVRRLTLERAGEEALIVVTSLLAETAYPAADVLEAYRERWGIERVFQQVTEVFHLQQLIGSSPEATIFQGAFCLQLYNLLQTVRRCLAEAQPEPPEVQKLSIEGIFYDVRRQLAAATELVTPADLSLQIPAHRSAKELLDHLRRRLTLPIPKLWWKSINKNPRKATPRKKQSGAHTSIARLQAKAKHKRNE